MDNLTELSQGWPQHVNRAAVAAIRVILKNGGRIAIEQIDEAMTVAREYKKEYYASRLAAGSSRTWVYRELALAIREKGGALSYDEIDRLIGFARNRTDKTTDEFLVDALRAGLLAVDPEIPDHYSIPIPSFGDYLRILPAKPP